MARRVTNPRPRVSKSAGQPHRQGEAWPADFIDHREVIDQESGVAGASGNNLRTPPLHLIGDPQTKSNPASKGMRRRICPMNTDLTRQLHAKYPAIFRNHCWLEHGAGWCGIVDAMCEAMTVAYTTCIHVDAARAKTLGIAPQADPDGELQYPLHVECPQVVVLQIKEKYATLRVHYRLEFEAKFSELAYGQNPMAEATRIADGYHSYMDGIVHLAETLSARTCEETGKPGELHVSYGGFGEWMRTLNREFAKTDPNCRSQNYVPAEKQNP